MAMGTAELRMECMRLVVANAPTGATVEYLTEKADKLFEWVREREGFVARGNYESIVATLRRFALCDPMTAPPGRKADEWQLDVRQARHLLGIDMGPRS